MVRWERKLGPERRVRGASGTAGVTVSSTHPVLLSAYEVALQLMVHGLKTRFRVSPCTLCFLQEIHRQKYNRGRVSDTSGSHGGEYEDGCLLRPSPR
jgi:hypothetical protein